MALQAALALSATAAAPVQAAAPVSSMPAAFALSPAGAGDALLLRGASGRVLRGAVRVRNVTGHSITVLLQPAGIQNASNGNADYVTAHLSWAGSWLQLAATSVHLQPHAERQVAFTVSIPAGARDASYYDGIVAIDAADLAAAAAHKPAKAKGFSFSRINRQALPLTIRLPGVLSRRLSLRTAAITVEPAGAGLVLGLLPDGSELIQEAQINLHVSRGSHAIFSYSGTLGQLFPGGVLSYRIPWQGHPTTGAYQVIGVIHPKGAATVNIDQTVEFTAASATRLQHVAQPVAQPSKSTMPAWVWLALAIAVALLAALSLAVWKLARRPTTTAV
ncbi:MAG: hypothetical protein ABSB69_05190 [Solirubrobacteraceae bacterium]